MKILYDHQIFSNQAYGGPSRYFTELIKELIQLNEEPTIIAPVNQNIYLKDINLKFKKEFFLKIKQKDFFTKIINDLFSNYYFRNSTYDLYHLTYYSDCYPSKKPKIITVYDLIHEKFMSEFKLNSLPKKKIFENVDHFLCISENTKKDLINYYNIDDKKITVTYLANSFKLKVIEKFPLHKPFLLYVGSRKRYKNFELLLKSFSLCEKIKKEYDIICFGGGEFIIQEIESMKNLSINVNSVHNVQGSDQILSSLYSSAEALVYPSKYEGFGLPILEAMFFGCPVIASNTSSLPEVCGDAALTFSPNSTEELINCINKISTDSKFKRELIKKGYEREKSFSWKKCALETYHVYKNLV